MNETKEEEVEKYNLLQKEMYREKEFLKKIIDIFDIINSEKFQDIIILQRNKYIEQVVKEVLLMLKHIYSENITTNKKFNTLFQLGKEDFEEKYNNYFKEISEEWDIFFDMKKNGEDVSSFYLTDFRKHCHNHDGLALHKCGRGENGKFIKISVKSGSRYRNVKELKYIICEECKKVYPKDLFNSYCPFCKENYLCNILAPNANKEYFMASYSTPHCDSFVNKAILCEYCKDKLYIFVNEKKLKCLNTQCNKIIDLNNKNELNWKCNKCNKPFKSGVKIYNPSENFILTKILKKALLIRTKAYPQYISCCKLDLPSTTFYHKKECKGILYICNIENYYLKSKKWVIVCEKCHAINNYKNFIWTCPNCGKRSKEEKIDIEENINLKVSPRKRSIPNKYSNLNKLEGEQNNQNNQNYYYQKYLSNYIIKNATTYTTKNEDKYNNRNFKERRSDYGNSNFKNDERYEKNNRNIAKVEQENDCIIINLVNNMNGKRNKYLRNNQNYKYRNKQNLSEENNQNEENKNNENTIPRSYIKSKNTVMYIGQKKEEEKNVEQKFQRGGSYNSNMINNDDKKFGRNTNDEYISRNGKKKVVFNIDNKNNMPVRLRYKIKNNKDNNIKISNDMKDQDYNKNKKEEVNGRNKNLNILLTSAEGLYSSKNSYSNGRISKNTTTQGSKGSITSSSKDNYVFSNYNFRKDQDTSDTSKDKDYFSSTSKNFKNKRQFYMQEKIKNRENNIKNLKSNIPSSGLLNRPIRNYKQNYKDNDYDNESNKPDDIIEPRDINYSEDIPIHDRKIRENKELYDKIENGIKKLLEKGKLPQFDIDNYTIEKKIGDGAFGVLFSVTNNKTNKKYALKKLTACDLKSLEEFQKEFIIAYQNRHKNILNLYGICIRVYDSTTFALFVLMDLAIRDWEIEINRRYKEKCFYTEKELISILKQLSSACVYLQKKEIAHRDIKPENILLFKENNQDIYKICDFGEAKEKIVVNQRHKSIRGTDFYMSPILFKGLTREEKYVKDNAYKSDVFSLGYCMIIACVLDFNFINKIRNEEDQTKIENIIRSHLEKRYSDKFIKLLLKMTVYFEKERVDFIGLQKLIDDQL